jgi:hypothetical protein
MVRPDAVTLDTAAGKLRLRRSAASLSAADRVEKLPTCTTMPPCTRGAGAFATGEGLEAEMDEEPDAAAFAGAGGVGEGTGRSTAGGSGTVCGGETLAVAGDGMAASRGSSETSIL